MARTKKTTVTTPAVNEMNSSIVEELIDVLVQPDSTPIEEDVFANEMSNETSDMTIDGPEPEPVEDEKPKDEEPKDEEPKDEEPKDEEPVELAYAVICAAVAKKRCVSTVAKKLIFEGLTNEQVFAELDAEFSIGEAKKSYPSWYRNDMIKKGIIARAEKTVKAPKAKVEKTVNALVIEDVIVEETTYWHTDEPGMAKRVEPSSTRICLHNLMEILMDQNDRINQLTAAVVAAIEKIKVDFKDVEDVDSYIYEALEDVVRSL